MRHRFSIAVIWSALGNWSREGINFLVFLILARLLGPEAYGLVGMAMVLAALAQIFLVDGIGTVLVQRKELEPGHIDMAFWLLLGVAGLISGAMLLGAQPLAAFYRLPEVADLVRFIAVLPPLFALCGVQVALLKRDMRFDVLTLRSILATIVGGLVGVGMALRGHGPYSLVAMFATQWTVQLIVLWAKSSWRPGLAARATHFRDIRRYVAETVGTRILMYLEQQLPRIGIGAFLGPVALGLFTMGWRLLEILSILVIMPVSQVAMPAFSRLQHDMERTAAALGSMLRLSVLLAFPAFIGLAAIAPVLVPLAFGEKWAEAVPVVQVMLLLGLPWAMTYCTSALMAGVGILRWRLILGWVSLAGLFLVLPVGYFHGMVALAWALVARAVLLLPLNFWVLRKELGIATGPLLQGVAPILIASLGMGAAVMAWQHELAGHLSPLALLASSILVGVVSYPPLVLLLARRAVMPLLRMLRGLRQVTP
ncbi:lipopolysaccharide biosynthesis protein [Aerophototrophica crusticola]|uniref:Lipopolysaccharide biosynthesis protein n=1 Tax=Aerophototrophica crusticola TaxID=1709002 RepID=A0A858R7Q0_9PROT|nr:lipopolysaccharide biosynthesis protein [Rhodospirillaceae bacterium B3]